MAGGLAAQSVTVLQGIRLPPVAHSALKPASWSPTKGASPLVRSPRRGHTPFVNPQAGCPRLAAERRVPIALLLQWVQRDATAGYPLLLGNARGGRDEPS